MLDHPDFVEEGDASVPEFLGVYKHEHGVYAIQMARLAQLRKHLLPFLCLPSYANR